MRTWFGIRQYEDVLGPRKGVFVFEQDTEAVRIGHELRFWTFLDGHSGCKPAMSLL